jgi:hypothetical protein
MMKRFVFLILVIFAFASCAEQNESERVEVPPPRPSIYGKWKDTPQRGSEVILTFQDNNLLNSEFLASNGRLFTEYYFYRVLPDDSVTFVYTRNVLEQKISVKVELVDENKIKLKCFDDDFPEGNGMLDPPMLCFYKDFIRIK